MIIEQPPTLSTARLTHEAHTARGVVEAWHREEHSGPFWICHEQPCHAVNTVVGDWSGVA